MSLPKYTHSSVFEVAYGWGFGVHCILRGGVSAWGCIQPKAVVPSLGTVHSAIANALLHTARSSYASDIGLC